MCKFLFSAEELLPHYAKLVRHAQVDLRSNLCYSGSTCSPHAVSLCHVYYVRSMQNREFLDPKSLTLA